MALKIYESDSKKYSTMTGMIQSGLLLSLVVLKVFMAVSNT